MIKLSVIVPVYNCEAYIENAVNSVINQNLSDIEIILIDDGSKDNSLNICKKIADRNESVRVLTQKNSGPGAARNKGIEIARGEYITFLDADDILPEKILKDIYLLLIKEEADIFVGNILCFDDVRTWHLPYMNEVFLPRGQVKINCFSEMLEVSGSPSVCNKWFKLSLIKENDITFNTEIKVGEDLLFTQEAFLNSTKIISKNIDIYNYRLIKKDSLIRKSNLEFFINLLEVQKKIINLYSNFDIDNSSILLRQLIFWIDSMFLKLENIPNELINNLVNLGISMFNITPKLELNEEMFKSKERYLLAVLFKENDIDNIIKFINEYMMTSKSKLLIKENNKYYSYLYQDFKKYKEILIQKPIIESKVENAYIEDNNVLVLRGYAFVRGIELPNKEIVKKKLVLKGKKNEIIKEIENEYRTDLTYLFRIDSVIYNWGGYKPIEINLTNLENDEYQVFLRVIIGESIFDIPFEFKLAEIKNKLKVFYLTTDNYKEEVFCRFVDGKYLNIRKRKLSKKSYLKSKVRKYRRDLRYDISLIKRKKYKSFLVLYMYKLFGKYLIRKDIWLMGERKDTAQDNTYHLFKYIKNHQKDINAKYIITKESKDLKYIKKYGNIVYFDSIRHNLYLLTCKFTINSYAERPNMYTSEYIDIIKYYPEFIKNKRVFLQHGVIGVSRVNHVLHKNRVNYDYFVVSSEFEKNHIIEEFGYKKDEVIVTGLPRWDNLTNTARKNKILLMPTWRSWIKSEEELLNSNYFKMYMELLNDSRLHKILEDNNYDLTFYPHYQTQKLLSKINSNLNSRIKIITQGEKTVQKLINENYVLITDYSTVAFDFAYANKKVIFYQFDYEEFYSKHYNEGPINHSEDLFGVRVENIDELLEVLLNAENIKMDKSYRYILKDKKHCEKVYSSLRNRNKNNEK